MAAERPAALLRDDARFRRYFLGLSTSTLGDRITFVALPFYARCQKRIGQVIVCTRIGREGH